MTALARNGSETTVVDGVPFINSELIRYFVSSGIALLVDVGTLYLLTSFVGVHYLVSAAIGFTLGLVTIYMLSIRWVFSKRRLKKTHHELFIFTLIGIGGLGINELGLFLLTDLLQFHFMISKLFVTGLVFSWNFGIRKLVLFR